MLLTALGCALQLAVALPKALPVVFGDRRRSVPVVAHPDGGVALRADLLGEAIGGQFTADGGVRYHLQVANVRIDVETGSALVRVDRDTLPLTSSIYRKAGVVYVPLAFASELLPRVVSGVLYDGDRGELRRFGSVTARRAPSVSPSVSPSGSASGSPSVAAPREPMTAGPSGAGRPQGLRQRVVVVDAGHGGVDKGMSGPIGAPRKVYEKDITLAVAREVKAALERRGIAVVMTRKSDTLIALGDRGRIANQAKGDLFMSVHVNAANPRWNEPGGARGFETYFLAEAKTEDERRVEAMENEAIKFETSAETTRDDPLGFIIRDMAQNEHLRESSRLADLVQSGLRKVHPGPNRGVKQAGFMVLVKAFMPAVLVEVGFGSNRSESAYMTNPDSQRALAEALADAAEAFLAQYERKVGGGS
ncbi:MAG: N-acetylmuramoyl-L-alanine amidase [Gemmatimonadaceae bacterium]|nr:N-acetylmuramoyl-L-alanine amidase [Gemmatimonadaceae bacterium]